MKTLYFEDIINEVNSFSIVLISLKETAEIKISDVDADIDKKV